MDFDEYEYLEKSVEDPDGRSRKENSGERREKGYRKRDEDDGEDRDVEDDDRKRKRSRNEDENGVERKREDRDRDRERRREKERDRDGDRDKDRERDRDRERRDREKERDRDRRDKEKEKEREREKEKEKEKDRDRDREKRDKDKEREKEKERERERSRSRRSSSRSRRSRSRSRRSRSRSRRSRSRSRRHDSRERERERERELREIESRDSRRFKDKKEAAEPEADPERDQRTVFAYQMPLKATERDVYEFFSKAGKVRDVRLIMDRNSRRSKGVGNAIKISMMRDDGNSLLSCLINSCRSVKSSLYIEFYDAMSVPMAIALSGQLLLGQPVMVKPSEAEKNLVQSTATTGASVTGPYGPTDRKLYVGNLHFNMTEQQLRAIFEPFGPVELVQLPLDLETGHCKGFGFVQFAQVEHAKAAQSLNGKLEIAGRYIKVSSVTEHVGGQEAGTTAADFDDDDGGGLALNAQSRALLMAKLDRTGTASSIAGSLGVPVLNGAAPVQQPVALPLAGQTAIPAPTLPGQVLPSPASEPVGIPTECLLLKNLFDPATETDPEFDLDIKEDVEEECSKFGRVRHIYVDKHSAGHVYLRFDNKEAAMNAQRGMHMRWFARRLISAIFVPTQDYEAKFRDSA